MWQYCTRNQARTTTYSQISVKIKVIEAHRTISEIMDWGLNSTPKYDANRNCALLGYKVFRLTAN